MAAITDLGNGVGKIYVRGVITGTPLTMSANIAYATYDNNAQGVIAAMADGLTASTVNESGVFDTKTGKLFFLYPDAAAIEWITTADIVTGVGATTIVDITSRIIKQGLESHLGKQSLIISGGVITPLRNSLINLITVDTEGGAATDLLDTITGTNFVDGDILILVGLSESKVTTLTNNVGNIILANGLSFSTGATALYLKTYKITLQYNVSAAKWYEIGRSPNITLDVPTMRAAGIPQPVSGTDLTAILAAGITVILTAGTNKGTQVFSSAPAVLLTGNVTIAVTGGTPLDGDEFWIDYRATLNTSSSDPNVQTGGFPVVIGGITLTPTQALQGRTVIRAKYKLSNTTWYYDLIERSQGRDLVDIIQLATKQNLLPIPAFSSPLLSYDPTTGLPIWVTSSAFVPNTIFVTTQAQASATPTPERADMPYGIDDLEIARLAAVALATVNRRILIVILTQIINQQIQLDNYVDWDLTGVVVKYLPATGDFAIKESAAGLISGVDSRIFGYPNITRSNLAQASAVGCIKIANVASAPILYLGNVTNNCASLTNTPITIYAGGNTVIYCNDIISSSTATAVTSTTGALTVLDNAKVYCNDIINNGTGLAGTIGALLLSGTPYIKSRNITITGGGASGASASVAIFNGDIECADLLCATGLNVGECIAATVTVGGQISKIKARNLINTSAPVSGVSRLISMDSAGVSTETGVIDLEMGDGTFTTQIAAGDGFIRIDGAAQLRVKYKKVLVNGLAVDVRDTSTSALLDLEGDSITSQNNNVLNIRSNALNVSQVTIKKSRLVTLLNTKDCIVHNAVNAQLIIDNTVLVAATGGAAKSISGTGTTKAYGLNVANAASSTGANVQVQNDSVQVTAGEFIGVATVV